MKIFSHWYQTVKNVKTKPRLAGNQIHFGGTKNVLQLRLLQSLAFKCTVAVGVPLSICQNTKRGGRHVCFCFDVYLILPIFNASQRSNMVCQNYPILKVSTGCPISIWTIKLQSVVMTTSVSSVVEF